MTLSWLQYSLRRSFAPDEHVWGVARDPYGSQLGEVAQFHDD